MGMPNDKIFINLMCEHGTRRRTRRGADARAGAQAHAQGRRRTRSVMNLLFLMYQRKNVTSGKLSTSFHSSQDANNQSNHQSKIIMFNHIAQLIEIVASIATQKKGARFASITYTAKGSGEVARHTLCLGVSVERAYLRDLAMLKAMREG